MEAQQQWVPNPKWLRMENGAWINRDSIEAVSIFPECVDEKRQICIYTQRRMYTLIDGFADHKAAQEHLDKLQLFYDLKPVDAPPSL